MNNKNRIIMNRARNGMVIIDIEGTIGVPEDWQFEAESERVATYERFRATLEQMRNIDASEVRVNIRSRGGSVEDALLIYEALCSLDAQVITYCHGYVASAATIIAQAGAERYISGGAMYLIHNATTAIDGNKEEAMRTAGILSKTDQRIARIYADRSGSGVEVFEELMGRDGGRGEWLSPEEVVEFGLADRVVEFSALKNLGQKIQNFAKSLGLEVSQLVDKVAQMGLEQNLVENNAAGQQAANEADNEVEAAIQQDESDLRQQVGPTITEPREDPALESPRQSPNQGAYASDVELFRSTMV